MAEQRQKTVRVAAVQLAATEFADAEASLRHTREMIEQAATLITGEERDVPRLVVLPEVTYPAYVLGSARDFYAARIKGTTVNPLPVLQAAAKAHGIHLVAGIATSELDIQPDLLKSLPPDLAETLKPAFATSGSYTSRMGRSINLNPDAPDPQQKPKMNLLADPTFKEEMLPPIYNEAVLIAPDGTLVGRSAKRLMWHFDNRWFCAGKDYAVFDTAFGRVGLIICADGRMPEIMRLLCLDGAQIIVDPTAWVTYGTDPRSLTNPQADYMLAARAAENGAWFVAANKVGIERGTVVYCGRSVIIDPRGRKVSIASSDAEEIVAAEIVLPSRTFPPVPRQPHLYRSLTHPTANLPVAATLDEPLVASRAVVRAAVVQTRPFETTEEMGIAARPLLTQLQREATRLAVMPDVPLGLDDGPAHNGDRVFPFYKTLSQRTNCAILATAVETEGIERRYKTARLFFRGIEYGRWRQTHFAPEDERRWTPGDSIGPVIELPAALLGLGYDALPQSDTPTLVRVGVMLGEDGLAFEVARVLMLAGADIILWPCRRFRYSTLSPLPYAAVLGRSSEDGQAGKSWLDMAQVARSRADENGVFVLMAMSAALDFSTNKPDLEQIKGGSSLIAAPNGAVLAATFADTEMAASASLHIPQTRLKVRAPGTDMLWNRQPENYGALAEGERTPTDF